MMSNGQLAQLNGLEVITLHNAYRLVFFVEVTYWEYTLPKLSLVNYHSGARQTSFLHQVVPADLDVIFGEPS